MNILFLGDSITDCGHSFSEDNLGNGYVKKLSLLPGVTAVNGGTDGFTFLDVLRKRRLMYARNVFDRVVITCGINDVSVIADLEAAGRYEDASAFLEDSIAALRTLLHELVGTTCVKKSSDCMRTLNIPASPSDSASHGAGILLLEPFLFPIPQARALWLPPLRKARERIQETIADFNKGYAVHNASAPFARYIPTQAALDGLAGQFGLPAITADGVHLTGIGHECLAKLVSDALTFRELPTK